MTSDASLGAVEFDPFSETFFNDPYDLYRQLRDHAPVYFNERYGFWALSRWDDVVEACRNWPTYSSTYGSDIASITSGSPTEYESLIFMDPPRHDRLRGLVSRVFTPRSIGALEPMIREVISGYLDRLGDRTEFDLVDEFSAFFPVDVICRMLGVPADMAQQVRHWLDISLTRDVGRHDRDDAAMEASIAMGTYFYELAVEKRTNPSDDMLSDLTRVEFVDEHGETTMLDDVEIAGFGSLIAGAGAETVTKLIGNAVVLFDQNPDQWQLVLDDPATIPGAVEEILRFHPPSQYQGRFTLREETLHGVTIPADSPVILLTGAATHDERAIPDPDRFDITRPPNLSLGFGYGIHSCLGAALARMESRIAIEELAARYPTYSVQTDGLRRVQMINVAGYSHVPVSVRENPVHQNPVRATPVRETEVREEGAS